MNENAIVEVFDLRGNVVGENSLNHGFNGLNGLHGLSAPNNKNRTFIWTTDETIASGIYLVRAYFNG
ncbi:hypothetical protein J7L68_07580 [bacterium]|nr:hypothetical protein [bacterium]